MGLCAFNQLLQNLRIADRSEITQNYLTGYANFLALCSSAEDNNNTFVRDFVFCFQPSNFISCFFEREKGAVRLTAVILRRGSSLLIMALG
ncbi:MAG: hypothetical protein DYH02_11395 [Candidatus Omnitrophica bacterium COP1]|nr:hypothetical protein [Candidatus Omnitrophica bacterium COP1]